jgi:hypothetical protein
VSPFFKGESDDDLTYSPLSKGSKRFPLNKGELKGVVPIGFSVFFNDYDMLITLSLHL